MRKQDGEEKGFSIRNGSGRFYQEHEEYERVEEEKSGICAVGMAGTRLALSNGGKARGSGALNDVHEQSSWYVEYLSVSSGLRVFPLFHRGKIVNEILVIVKHQSW